MRIYWFLTILVLSLLCPSISYASVETNVDIAMKKDTVLRSIQAIVKSRIEGRAAVLDSLNTIVESETESPYYIARKAILGGIKMRLVNHADVDSIQILFNEYSPYLKQLDEKYYFYEYWYYLVECYLFSGHIITAADEAREVYLQAVREGDKLGLALSTYVLGMFYQMQ
ncbi:MAG: hypothetical protein Q4C30_07165, partial [Bacteroidia bacterium]|nr:hypothetical protein [Bacteroidia bacterium]